MSLQIALSILAAASLIVVLFLLYRARLNRARIQVGTLPEKVLEQLGKIRQNLERDKSPHFEKRAFSYYKRLKVTLVVYMKETFGLTVRDRITDDQKQAVTQRFPQREQEIYLLQKYFAELDNIKEEKNVSKKRLRRLLSDVESLFERKASQHA